MVSQQHTCILDIYPSNIITNLSTNLPKIYTTPLILTIIFPTKYGTNPLANLWFNLHTNLPTLLLPTHLPLTSQWDNLAMNITLTNLQFGTSVSTKLPLTNLLLSLSMYIQFSTNLPTILPTHLPHTSRWDNIAIK